jgi:hypothetical protein
MMLHDIAEETDAEYAYLLWDIQKMNLSRRHSRSI